MRVHVAHRVEEVILEIGEPDVEGDFDLIDDDEKHQRRNREPVLADCEGAERPDARAGRRCLDEIGIHDRHEAPNDRQFRDQENEDAEQCDGDRQAVGQGVITVCLRPKPEVFDEVGRSEHERFDPENDLEYFQKGGKLRRQQSGERAAQRRRREDESHRIAAFEANYGGGDGKQDKGEAEDAHAVRRSSREEDEVRH